MSPEKAEAIYLRSPLIEQVFVDGDSTKVCERVHACVVCARAYVHAVCVYVCVCVHVRVHVYV